MSNGRSVLAAGGPLSVEETNEGRAFWLSQPLGKGLETQLTAADALIVPKKEFRAGVAYVFHQDTGPMFRFLSAHAQGQLTVELLARDDEYLEVSLHSATIRLSTVVVGYVVAPLIMNLLSSYLYDQLKAKQSDAVEATIVVEDHDCKTFKFAFKGEAKDFHLLADSVEQMARNCKAKATAPKGGSSKPKK